MARYVHALVLLMAFSGSVYVGITDVETMRSPVKTSGAMEALDFWSQSRAYPEAVIPEEGYVKGFDYSRQTLRKESDQAGDVWSPIGPHNIGGRTIAVAFNPHNGNTIFAGSASGGLWRSRTGGVGSAAWEYLPTGFPVLGVGAIAISPVDSNIMYIGTGEVYGYQNSIGGLSVRTTRGSYGIGVLKSVNGGSTWQKVIDWSMNQQRGVQVLRLNPLNPNTVWAGTTEGTYKSTDAGATWSVVHNVIMVTDIAINPLDTNLVFVACGNLGSTGNGMYRTINGGTSWVRLTTNLPSSYGGKALLAMYRSSPNVIFASIGFGSSSGSGTSLMKSTNNGDTWSQASNLDYSTYQGWFAHFVGVHPVDSSKIICAGVDIFKSTTGGTNLLQRSFWYLWYFGVPPPGGPEGPPDYSHADHHAIAYHPTNPDIIYFGNDGGVFRTTDGGETFEGCNGGYQTTQFYNGFSSALTDSALSIGGMQDNATAIYEGSVAWRRVIGGDGCWTALHPENPDTMYGSSQSLNIARSVNRGVNWSGATPPGSARTSFVAPYVISPSHPAILYAGRDKIFKSTMGGVGWTVTNSNVALDGNPALAMAISRNSPDTVYCATAPIIGPAGVFVTTNGGVSWTNITGTLPNRYPIDLAVDPDDASIVYIAFSGFGTSHLFRSTNTGDQWLDIGAGLPDVPTSAVVVDPLYRNHIYVGNDIGVYLSTNGGATWEEFQTGMSDAAIVMDLSISPANRSLRAVTHGKGVFERPLFDSPNSVGRDQETAVGFRLDQNFPNPLNPTTTISYHLQRGGWTTLEVFDLGGRKVATLVDEERPAGRSTVVWNADQLASGVYLYRLKSSGYQESRKLILIR